MNINLALDPTHMAIILLIFSSEIDLLTCEMITFGGKGFRTLTSILSVLISILLVVFCEAFRKCYYFKIDLETNYKYC